MYVEHDGVGNLIVTTENGAATTNVIIFEPDTLVAFIRYAKRAYGSAWAHLEREL